MFANKNLFDDDDTEVDVDAIRGGNADRQNRRATTQGQTTQQRQPPSARRSSTMQLMEAPILTCCCETVTFCFDARSADFSSPAASSSQRPGFDRAQSSTHVSQRTHSGGATPAEDLPSTPTPAMRRAKMEEMKRAHLDKRKQKAMAAPTVLRQNEDQLIKSPGASAAATGPLSPSAASSPKQLLTRANTFAYGSSPRASGGQYGGAASPSSPGGDSDDEDSNAAVAVDMSDPHMANLLAAKRAEQGRKHISQAERDMLEQGIAPVYDPVKHTNFGGVISNGSGGGVSSAASAASSSSSAGGSMHHPHHHQLNVKMDYSDMRSFLMSPIPKGVTFQCYILRNKKGLLNKLYPTYECYVSGEERFLMAARKRTQNKTSNYMISSDKTNIDSNAGGKDSSSYLGKVRSNFVGTEFVAYDKGLNPSEIDGATEHGGGGGSGGGSGGGLSMLSVRQELCAVFYESNILGSKGPRKMTAVVPSIRSKDGHRAIWKPMNSEQSIAVLYRKNPQNNEYLTLVNKTPKWNDAARAYVLNFNGRVTEASVKNFQLCCVDRDQDAIILQFGRIGKDTFTMDLQWPLSPMQAFAIALTSFDSKIACE